MSNAVLDKPSSLVTNNDRGSAVSIDVWAEEVLPSRTVLVALCGVLVVFKSLYFFAMPIGADEAYYWLWGQNPALSYYDHPPLLAWVQTVSDIIFGWSVYSARMVTLATGLVAMWVMWFWCERLAPACKLDVFLASVFFVMMTPLILRFQSIAIQDCLLIAMTMMAMHFLALFVETTRTKEIAWSLYWLACVFIGLAALSKYNGVFVAAGVAVFAFVTPLGRQLLLRWQFWVGPALVLVMQSPVIAWNMTHNWPSFRYNLQDRIGASIGGGFLDNVVFLAVNSLIMLGPVFLIAVVRFTLPGRIGMASDVRRIARWVIVTSTVTFVGLSVTNTVLPYWNMAAYAVVLPVLIFFVKSRMEFYIHTLFCLAVGAWLMLSYGLYPLHKHNGRDIRDVDISTGLSYVADEISRAEGEVKPDFVLTTDYRTASMLAITRGRDDVVKMGRRNDQFDFWLVPEERVGQTALVLADDHLPIDELVTNVFEEVRFLREINVRKFDFNIHTYRLYLATNYSGQGPH